MPPRSRLFDPPPITYVDRETGERREERVLGGRSLWFMYRTMAGSLLVRSLLSWPIVSKLYGLVQNSRLTRSSIETFARELDIDVDEADRPIEKYDSLNDFFTRKLRPECRPVARQSDVLISPADARLLVYPEIDSDTVVPIKGARWSIQDLLADEFDAEQWQNGTAIVLRLAPCDYHRFHFPDVCIPSPPTAIDGELDSVNPIAMASGRPIFVQNSRVVTTLRSDNFGDIAMVEIGAMFVGSIVQTFSPREQVAKGEEKGYFQFGGSSIVLLFEPDTVTIDHDLRNWSAEGLETLVKFGEQIGVRASP